jgi:hypothetical protein
LDRNSEGGWLGNDESFDEGKLVGSFVGVNVGVGDVLLPLPLDAFPLLFLLPLLPLLSLLLLLPLPLNPVPLPPFPLDFPPVAIDGYTEGDKDGIIGIKDGASENESDGIPDLEGAKDESYVGSEGFDDISNVGVLVGRLLKENEGILDA